MPKQPGGISKFQRMEALRAVLVRWGKLNKQQIDDHVAKALGCDAPEISRALYREELENLTQIKSTHFTRDGQEITDYDPAKHKNTYGEWFIAGGETFVQGEMRLAESGIKLAVSPRLRKLVSVIEMASSKKPEGIGIYFESGTVAHSLVIKPEAFPFVLWLSRCGKRDSSEKLLSAGEAQFGHRLVCLQIPCASVSSVKNVRESGHLSLTFKDFLSLTIQDCNSKNGTYYRLLDKDRGNVLVENALFKKKATTTHQLSLDGKQHELSRVKPENPAKVNLPVKIFASLDFSLYILKN